MLIAQITDVHLGFEPDNPDEYNRRRLDRVAAVLRDMAPRPDLLLVTGDLADRGDDDISYARLVEALAGCPFPVHYGMGNHDTRASFLGHFPDTPSEGGFIHYAIEDHPLRILMLDTLELGRQGGGFCEARAAWLRARLDEEPAKPTLIALHHPPIDSGLSWMTENPDAGWIRRLEAVVSGRPNIVAILAGHLHRPVTTMWAGTRLTVCPSVAPQVALDLAAIDPDRPDGRPMIVADPPGYGLHRWDGRALMSHFDTAEDHVVMARYEPALQPLVRLMAAEKASG